MQICKKHPKYKPSYKEPDNCPTCRKIWIYNRFPELLMKSGIFVWANRSGEVSGTFFDEFIELDDYPLDEINPDIGTFTDALVKVVEYFRERGFTPSKNLSAVHEVSISEYKEIVYVELQDFLNKHDQGWLKVVPQY